MVIFFSALNVMMFRASALWLEQDHIYIIHILYITVIAYRYAHAHKHVHMHKAYNTFSLIDSAVLIFGGL